VVARACEWPPQAAARRTREGVANEVSDEAGEARGAVAVLCGVGHNGAAASTKHGDSSTADRERSGRSRSAASRASSRGWGFDELVLNRGCGSAIVLDFSHFPNHSTDSIFGIVNLPF
jgi:hypothetical protein